MEDALAAVQDGKLVDAQKLLAQFLIVQRVGSLPAPALAGVVGVYCLLTQSGGQLLEGGRLLAAEKNGAVAVADDDVGVVLVNRLELALRLEDEAGRDFPAADGRHELFQLGNLADVGAHLRYWRTAK